MTTESRINTRRRGAVAEQLACDYLVQQGYILVAKNWRYGRIGELDLIMRRHDGLMAFVEVKATHWRTDHHPLEMVTPAKQRQIIRVALAYLQEAGSIEGVDFSFDVVGVQFRPDGHHEITHIPNAFDASNMIE